MSLQAVTYVSSCTNQVHLMKAKDIFNAEDCAGWEWLQGMPVSLKVAPGLVEGSLRAVFGLGGRAGDRSRVGGACMLLAWLGITPAFHEAQGEDTEHNKLKKKKNQSALQRLKDKIREKKKAVATEEDAFWPDKSCLDATPQAGARAEKQAEDGNVFTTFG